MGTLDEYKLSKDLGAVIREVLGRQESITARLNGDFQDEIKAPAHPKSRYQDQE